MQKKIMINQMLAVIILLISTEYVKAEEIKGYTNGNVTFVTLEEVEVNPVLPPDPENPDVEIEVETGVSGVRLDFNYLIGTMTFGKVKLREGGVKTAMLAEVKKHTNGELLPTYSAIQVRDLRGDSEMSWRVDALMSSLVNEKGEELEGVYIEMTDGWQYNGKFSYDEKISLVPNDVTTVMTREKKDTSSFATLIWLRQVGAGNEEGLLNRSINLVIPANSKVKAGSYTGTIEWVLTVVPGNEIN